MNKKLKLTLFLILWAVLFFIIGLTTAKANNMALQYGVFYPQYVRNANCDVEKILIEKSKNKMTLLDCYGNRVKSYTVRVGYNEGAKQCEGDKKTPEGDYKIVSKRESKYVYFLEINYPAKKDIEKAKELGCKPGDAIGIHYFNKELNDKNTQYSGSNGCATVWDKEEIKEIYKLVKIGTTVEIRK